MKRSKIIAMTIALAVVALCVSLWVNEGPLWRLVMSKRLKGVVVAVDFTVGLVVLSVGSDENAEKAGFAQELDPVAFRIFGTRLHTPASIAWNHRGKNEGTPTEPKTASVGSVSGPSK